MNVTLFIHVSCIDVYICKINFGSAQLYKIEIKLIPRYTMMLLIQASSDPGKKLIRGKQNRRPISPN